MKRHVCVATFECKAQSSLYASTYHFTSVDKAQDADYNLQKDEDDQSNCILVVYYGGWGEL